MIFDAILFAAKAHTGQFRKGTAIPYVFHPVNVAKTLLEYGCSEEIVIAGLLHDVVEDTPVTLADIRQAFGEAVARLVEGTSEPDKSEPWENRKQHTIEALETASPEVLLITCADKLDNLRSIREDSEQFGESIWDRFRRPKEKQRWYYEALADALGRRMEREQEASLYRQFKAEVLKVFGDDEGGTGDRGERKG